MVSRAVPGCRLVSRPVFRRLAPNVFVDKILVEELREGIRALSRDLRMKAAAEGLRIPIDVQEGAYEVAPGTRVSPDSVAEAKRRGYV